MTGAARPRRPAYLPHLEGFAMPATSPEEVAHRTAQAVLNAGRETEDPAVRERLLRLAEEVGVDELAELWRASPHDTLPGTLWALYLLRTWVRHHGAEAARLFSAGRRAAEVSSVVAGVAEPPGPQEVAELGDAVLTSAFTGDLADALERAAAFCRVVAAGRAAEDEPAQHVLGHGNLRMAAELEHAAALWRKGALH